MCDTFQGMAEKPWRDRVLLEEQLLEQLSLQTSQAAKRRAAALADGVAELGSVYAVAKELSRSWTAVSNAIKRNGPAVGPTTTE